MGGGGEALSNGNGLGAVVKPPCCDDARGGIVAGLEVGSKYNLPMRGPRNRPSHSITKPISGRNATSTCDLFFGRQQRTGPSMQW